jgi:hypothetical protein
MVLCLVARQGIHINRTEDRQGCCIARQGIHLLPVNPRRGMGGRRRYTFSMDMVSLTGNKKEKITQSSTEEAQGDTESHPANPLIGRIPVQTGVYVALAGRSAGRALSTPGRCHWAGLWRAFSPWDDSTFVIFRTQWGAARGRDAMRSD